MRLTYPKLSFTHRIVASSGTFSPALKIGRTSLYGQNSFGAPSGSIAHCAAKTSSSIFIFSSVVFPSGMRPS